MFLYILNSIVVLMDNVAFVRKGTKDFSKTGVC